MDMSRLKDSRQYKNLETDKKKIKNRVLNEIYYDSAVSLCKKKEQYLLGLVGLRSETVFVYLIEGRNKEYKVGYKSNVAEEFRTEIQFVPAQTSLDDYADVSFIKDVVRRNEQQIQIVFKDIKKKKWTFVFRESKLCQSWEELLKSKIMEVDKMKVDRENAHHLGSIHLPAKTKQVSCQTEHVPSDFNPKQLSDIPSSYKESSVNPFNVCMKKASQGKHKLDRQDLGLLKAELRRMYLLQLSEQRYVEYFMGVCVDMLETVMALKREALLSNQKILALQQTNSILAQQCYSHQIKININRPRDQVIQQIRQDSSQKKEQESVTQLDSIVTLLQSVYLGPNSQTSRNRESQRFSLSNLQFDTIAQSIMHLDIEAAQTSKFLQNKKP